MIEYEINKLWNAEQIVKQVINVIEINEKQICWKRLTFTRKFEIHEIRKCKTQKKNWFHPLIKIKTNSRKVNLDYVNTWQECLNKEKKTL